MEGTVSGYEPVDEDAGTSPENRRIKMADFNRLKRLVENLAGQVEALTAIAGRKARLSRDEFAGQFYASAAAWDGSKVKNFQAWCEASYASYCAFCDGAPAPSLESRYGRPEVVKVEPPRPAPSGNGLAIPVEKAPVAASATA